jgi:hypothetical protein
VLLPDIPRFVETRAMLLGGYGEVFGLAEGDGGLDFVALDREGGLACVVGRPGRGEIARAVSCVEGCDVLAFPENVAYVMDAVPEREAQPATLHVLGGDERLPAVPEGRVRLVGSPEGLDHAPPELRAELEVALRRSSVAATVADGLLVSFCTALPTEGLWDVGIDTLAPYRRGGHAELCVSFMVRHMREGGREPFWGALESNAPSMRLASKLGFVPVDRVFVFEAP